MKLSMEADELIYLHFNMQMDAKALYIGWNV